MKKKTTISLCVSYIGIAIKNFLNEKKKQKKKLSHKHQPRITVRERKSGIIYVHITPPNLIPTHNHPSIALITYISYSLSNVPPYQRIGLYIQRTSVFILFFRPGRPSHPLMGLCMPIVIIHRIRLFPPVCIATVFFVRQSKVFVEQ